MREDVEPLSFPQERLWFVNENASGRLGLNLPVVLRLRGPLRPAGLAASLADLVRRHAILRTTIHSSEQGLYQRIHAEPVGDLHLEPEPIAGGDTELARRAAAEWHEPFALDRGPLLRARLLALGAEDHALIVTVHHVAGDAWSIDVLISEILAGYAAWVTTGSVSLPAPALQYVDFSRAQRRWASGPECQEQLDYWRRHLDGAPPSLELPLDRPRPAVQTFPAGVVAFRLEADLVRRLRAQGRSEGATPFMVLSAAVACLLARWTGQDDLVLGTPIACRDSTEVENLFGPLLNNLPLRLRVDRTASFRRLLRHVREVALDGYANHDVPFERLLQVLQPPRDASRTPVFQVLVNMIVPSRSLPTAPSLAVEVSVPPHAWSYFDLTVYFRQLGPDLDGELVYNRDLFDAERMRDAADQLTGLLRQMAADPDLPAAAASLVTGRGRRVVPDPRAALAVPWPGTVAAVVQARAAARPDAMAVVGEGGARVSYGALVAQSERVAGCLRAGGVGRGDVVAIHAVRRVGLVTAMLGVLRAGAAFVMVDAAYPAARQAELVERVTPRGWLEVGDEPDGPGAGIAVRLRIPADVQGEGEWPAPPAMPEDGAALGYVAFTSGSTGQPRGIQGQVGPLSQFVGWYRERWGLGAEERVSMLSGLAHDPLHRDVFLALQLGAVLCVPSAEEMFGAGRLARWMSEQEITVTNLTPGLLQLVVQAAEGEGRRLERLRWAFVVGEALKWREVERLRRVAPQVRVVNLYGTTETGRALGYCEVPRAESGGSGTVAVGRGVEGVQLLVVSEGGQQAGIGELGEIWVRSPLVTAGYMGEAAETAGRYVRNPFTGQAEDRVYRTGDLGRYTAGGEVVFAGRADSQVKIRGFRVEPAEVEARLLEHPALRGAAVSAAATTTGSELIAHVVAQGARPPLATELRDFLLERVPPYMVPTRYYLLDALPLTPSGKLDHVALHSLVGRPLAASVESAPPQGPIEEHLARIWREVLRVDRVGRTETFFTLGGHSLLAVELVHRVATTFRTELPLSDLALNPTLAGLATALVRREARPGLVLAVARLRTRIDGMSEEEIHSALNRRTRPTAAGQGI